MSQSFDDFDLHPALNRALAEMGFTRPTTIQQMVLEPALDGRDILASAPTGTGKTASSCCRHSSTCWTSRAASRAPAAC